ncbi:MULTISPECIES: cytochrome o ubiquinol oxidase subunit III [Neokomagataea]|uniref:Cytochrome bo(3) ubiquinol oxidase subunit 3 n=2 Tax=Neokomagataea TaxID=1223423 RepID=A0ABQ0QG35_9PROT|nr:MULTISPECIES: cytochrome o ubiquinol oxidase subunit III [Neokomagataea]MBR0558633.1 cytochrome o ubiquinol oxidase subunit III [Neokomagataea anthophila]GBR43432.1 cytochrome o ubiquinol oxidase subunit III [Neokomagataea tanensis NBRC 106556]
MAHEATMSPAAHADHHDGEHHHETPNVFGFWVYLMTDCVLFGTIFAVFAVMRNQFAGGPTGKELFDLQNVGIETAILLFSSITYGFASINAHAQKKGAVLLWLAVTFLLGASFVGLEVNEFHHMIAEGNGPDRSAFLSAFFTLVGTHGLHVTCGLIWMVVLMVQMLGRQGLKPRMMDKLACLSLFWHFLDIVWICVFSFVYLASTL